MANVSAKILGEYLLLTQRRVQQFASDGVLKRSKAGFDLKAAVNGYIRFLRRQRGAPAKAYDDARTERMQAMAKLADLDLEERLGNLHPTEAIERNAVHAITNATSQLLGLPAMIAPLVAGKSVDETRAILDDQMRRTLDEFADGFTVAKLTGQAGNGEI